MIAGEFLCRGCVPSHPLCPAGHLPRKGGDWLARRLSPITGVAESAPAPELPISPLAGEMAGRPEGGAVPPANHMID
ncbi:MAG: lytic murein transglycosylase [Mesorhizobium sp.]|nr:MAG: lytic murein transglycosylase [Mesorhizobium sp.]TIV47363.1 MAG: lytic murein transglycosylase [Mesorhizobium sp.]